MKEIAAKCSKSRQRARSKSGYRVLSRARVSSRSSSSSRYYRARSRSKTKFTRSTPIKSGSSIFRGKKRLSTYVLRIMGKLLLKRLKRSSLISRGVDLVRKFSSCSLLGWSGRLLDSKKIIVISTRNNCGTYRHKNGKVDLPPTITKRARHDVICRSHQKSPASRGLIETVDLNCNLNARTPSITREDVKQDMSGRPDQDGQSTSQCRNTRKRNVRKVVRHRGLVARSIGKPKVRERMGGEGNRRAKRIHSLGKTKRKYKTRKVFVRRLCTSIRSKLEKDENISTGDNQDRGVPVLVSGTVKKFHGTSTQTPSKTESPKVKSAPAQKDIGSGSAVSNDGKSKSHKWKTLMRLGNSVLAGHMSSQTSRKKRWERKVVEQRARQDRTEFQSESRSPVHDHSKGLSPDNSEWPSLPASGRTRAYAKETATEIVKSKHSASATKTTRKGWADIVSKRSKDTAAAGNNQQVKDMRKSEAGSSAVKKTWASVAAAGTSKHKETIGRDDAAESYVGQPSAVTPSGSSNPKKKRRKADYSLAYTDRIWLTCQKSKGNSHAQNFYRKRFRDKKDKASKRKCNSASPRKKMHCEKRRDLSQQEKQASLVTGVGSFSQSSSKEHCPGLSLSPAHSTPGADLKCTSSNRDSEGQNACLVDNMPVVYTKKAGMVISLNESSHDRTTHKNMNKCNNRLTRAGRCRILAQSRQTESDDSVVPSSISGADLCSQLSSMTFQTPDASCCAFKRESSASSGTRKTLDGHNAIGASRRSQPSGQPNISKASHSDGFPTKQKKVSLRYRALLCDGCGPLDARVVSDINTRNRRADTLQDNKVATRAMRRRQRQQLQNTTHGSRRAPASFDSNESRQPSKPGSSTQPDQAECGNSHQALGSRGVVRPRSRARKTLTALLEGNDACEASTSSNTGQRGSPSSSASSDCDVSWRPTDNSGTNNSRPQHNGSRHKMACPQLVSLRKHAIANMLGPVFAKSAPQLSEHRSSSGLDLSSNLQTLDMSWWNAYLQQPGDI